MPEVKELHKFIAGRDDMAMLTVSMDSQSTAQRLRDTIREHRIRYPVLHINAEDGWNDGAFDWSIHGVPTAFIIDPQGNIFADVYPRAALIDTFKWLADQETAIPPLGFSTSAEVQDDGSTKVTVSVSSPSHAPVDVDVSGRRIYMVYDPERDPNGTGEPNSQEYRDLSEDGEDYNFTATYGEFGDYIHEFIIPAHEGDVGLYVRFTADIPGMEEFNGGSGFSVGSWESVRFPKPEEE